MLRKNYRMTMRHDRVRRGAVLILVVSVLALLAVLGTVYIVSARAQRKAAASMSTTVNTTLAERAIMNMVVQAVGDSALDANGQPCGYASGASGTYGTEVSRFYDFPEAGGVVVIPSKAGKTKFGQTDASTDASSGVGWMKDEPWLALKMHVPVGVNFAPGALYMSGPDFTSITNVPYAADWPDFSRLTETFFDPSSTSGSYAIKTSQLVRAGSTMNSFGVIFDQTDENGTNSSATNSYNTTIDGLSNDCSNPDVTYLGAHAYDINRFNDAFIQLLPFSDANGTRYRFGLRILDTNRMANLNVGSTNDAAAMTDVNGAYITSMRLSATTGMPSVNTTSYYNTSVLPNKFTATDTENNLHVTAINGLGRAGTSATYNSFSQGSWIQAAFQMEQPSDTLLAFFDLSDELALRSYGEFGTFYHVRAAGAVTANTTLWPKTLSANPTGGPLNITKAVKGNAARRNYTTYSWSRDLRPYNLDASLTKYIVTPTTGGIPSNWTAGQWPPFPAKISANPLTTPSPATNPTNSDDVMYYAAMAATNIATLMQNGVGTPGYTQSEACSFAANYCTARWNGFQADPAFPNTLQTTDAPPVNYGDGKAYYLPAGPSFVDTNGLHYRAAGIPTFPNAPTVYTRDFNVAPNLNPGTNVYLGYAAQPYFSEIAANESLDDTGITAVPPVDPHAVVNDVAIELFNPYPVNLSLTGFHLKSGDGTADIPLDGQFIPANGYLVILNSSGGHYPVPTPHPMPYVMPANKTFRVFTPPAAAGYSFTLNTDPNAVKTFVLYRPYTPAGGGTALAPIDRIDYSTLVDPNGQPPLPSQSAGNPPKDFTIFRAGGKWGPTVQIPMVRNDASLDGQNAPFALTLGEDNNGGATGYPLPDRYAYAGPPPTSGPSSQGTPMGMGEFARIPRLSHQFDSSGNPVSLISDQIAGLSSATPPYTTMDTTQMNLPINAQILFDFYADPSIYNTAPGNLPAFPSFNDPTGKHDIRAVRLLEQITMVDRVSEFGISIGGPSGQFDLNKLRVPGLINVNTASPDVLRAIPNMTDQMVANIIAYRRRANLTPPSYPPSGSPNTGTQAMFNSVTNTKDYSNQTTYPGYGFRSLAEMLVPLADTTATSIDARDKVWGSICNCCTVRSDTFVVYGFLQAVRQTPAYVVNLSLTPPQTAFDNQFDWYSTTTGSDPQDTSSKLCLVGQRRFIAIVDRSFCNNPPFVNNVPSQPNPNFSRPRIVAIQELPY